MPRISATVMDEALLARFVATMRDSDPEARNGGYSLLGDDAVVELVGTFSGNQNGFPTSGTITGIRFYYYSLPRPGFQAFELNIPFATFRQAVEANNVALIQSLVFGGADTVTGASTDTADVLRGYAGNDTISGNNGADTFYGDEGDDTLEGGLNNDTLYGGVGDDFLNGLPGDDRLDGGEGADTAVFANVLYNYVGVGANVSLLLQGQAQNTGFGLDTLVGVENVHGTSYSDTLRGDGGANRLFGLGQGNDQLFGEGGDDLLVMNATGPAAGSQTFDGGAGSDTLRFVMNGVGVTFSLAAATRQTIGSGSLLATSVESIESGNGADILTGDAGANSISGGAGADRIDGGNGDDTLIGGDGDDILTGGLGVDRLTGGAGADTFVFRAVGETAALTADVITDFQTGVDRIDLSGGLAREITLTAEGGSTWVRGAMGNEAFAIRVTGTVAAGDLITTLSRAALTGGAAAETLTGGASAEVITGAGGGDRLTGGAGSDVFRYLAVTDSDASGADLITDFATGVDLIDFAALGTTQVSLIRSGGATFLFGTTAGAAFQLASLTDVNGSDFVGVGHGVYLIGSEQADTLIGSALGDPLQGNGGADILIGGLGADAISGGAGADVFRYRAANESVAAGGAYDNLYDFETGIDRIDLTAVAPTEISLIRDGGSSYIFVSTPNGPMQIIAAGRAINAPDIVHGGSFGVYVIGGAANDTLIGSANADPIEGRAGDDVIIGGGGADALFGNEGADTYRYLAAPDSSQAFSDRIFGFVSGSDRIDLTAVRTGASDAFGIAYQGGGSFIFVDLGGNGSTDMLIQVIGTVTAGDLLWTPPSSALAGPEAGAKIDPDVLGWMADHLHEPGGADWMM